MWRCTAQILVSVSPELSRKCCFVLVATCWLCMKHKYVFQTLVSNSLTFFLLYCKRCNEMTLTCCRHKMCERSHRLLSDPPGKHSEVVIMMM